MALSVLARLLVMLVSSISRVELGNGGRKGSVMVVVGEIMGDQEVVVGGGGARGTTVTRGAAAGRVIGAARLLPRLALCAYGCCGEGEGADEDEGEEE